MSQRPPLNDGTRLPVDIRLRRILLVDDDLLSRRMALRLLEQFSFTEVIEATNGSEALDVLANSAFPIDLLIVDLIMPVMDGFDFIEQVRLGMKVPDPRVPIIVMSGRADPETLQRVKKLGINGFVTKPPQSRNFFERIVTAMRSAQAQARANEPQPRKMT
ncbi:response regulator [Ferrovibrio sp.]|uniref:response regulator n=1 Tax=Ferrovibrio sp. TaxID=1917215 RepID=UPI0025BCD2B8|nr:response regulator [Ferrovibrio sp.]MBX3456163.1 response regulator [Ferrovibrio sp.]